MRWTRGDRGNIEDLRGRGGLGGFGMRRGMPIGCGGLLLLLILSWLTGADFLSLLSGGGAVTPPSASVPAGEAGEIATTPEEEHMVDMVDAVLEDAQQMWQRLLGERYQPTRVRVFRDVVQSACGTAESASGPFYCPGDHRVYLDISFFNELHRRFEAPGDFAQAYVIAHELGHHVQNVLGIERRVRSLQQSSRSEANQLSVRMELQADCFAGIWGHEASREGRAAQGRVELDSGDMEEGLQAASAIGDDRIQRKTTGRVVPDAFTHGSSEQRMTWFRRGLTTGSVDACNTFQ